LEPEFIRNKEFLQYRADHGFGSKMITKEEMLRLIRLANEAVKRENGLLDLPVFESHRFK